MKEQDLIDLGFYLQKRQVMKIDFSDSRGLSLISNSNDEAEKAWVVEIFDYDNITFTDVEKVLEFITIIKQNTHEK